MRSVFFIVVIVTAVAALSCRQTPTDAPVLTADTDTTVMIKLPESSLCFNVTPGTTAESKLAKPDLKPAHKIISTFYKNELSDPSGHPADKPQKLWMPFRQKVLLVSDELPCVEEVIVNEKSITFNRIRPEQRIWVQFDNDIFSNTDRYYTNGIIIGISAPFISTLPINKLMPAGPGNGSTASSISLHHSMFTPHSTKQPPSLHHDRPYASVLLLNYTQITTNHTADYEIITSLKVGLIGDAALGKLLQQAVHTTLPGNDTPMGWETQIRNDLILNYNLQYSRRLVDRPFFNLHAGPAVSLGTLYTQASGHLNIRAGKFNHAEAAKVMKWQYGMDAGISIHWIGYDATLQGGLLNRSNVFTLASNEIQRVVPHAHLGFFAGNPSFQINLTQHYLGREFKSGRHHFWGSVALQYNF